MNKVFVGSILICAAAAFACGHDSPPPQTPPPPAPAAAPPQKTDQAVSLSKDIRDACKIDDSDRQPKFDFDSTQLSSTDRDILNQLATCLTTGALKGRSIQLIGRADSRGEAEYNMTLGGSRATSVLKYLASLGVDNGKMSETSRGALDATGQDEAGWRKDRRVDVSLK